MHDNDNERLWTRVAKRALRPQFYLPTRLHCSRMCTTRALAVFGVDGGCILRRGCLLMVGVGVSAPGGVVCLFGGVSASWGEVSACGVSILLWGVCSWGVSSTWGGCLLLVDRQTPVNFLPFAGGNNDCNVFRMMCPLLAVLVWGFLTNQNFFPKKLWRF